MSTSTKKNKTDTTDAEETPVNPESEDSNGITEDQYNELRVIKEKSEDDYEKNLVYISSGTLVLSLTFIEKIVPLQGSTVVWFLIDSWIFLSVTLLLNLISHQISSKHHDDCMRIYSTDREAGDKLALQCSKIMRRLNWVTSSTLISGIFLLVLFCSINALNMSKEKATQSQTISPDRQTGRTVTTPANPKGPKGPKGTSGNTSGNNTKSK
jgi:hypothetical protein